MRFEQGPPGFTHLQPAQPVTFGHHLMAYDAMFARDAERQGGHERPHRHQRDLDQ